MSERPPRGYTQQQFPLPHSFNYSFDLEAEDETKNSTIMPFFKMTEEGIAPETINVNPRHPSFAVDGGTAIHQDSIVPKITVAMRIVMNKLAIETDKMRSIIVNYMPIYTAFLNSLDAEDEKTTTDIEGILKLTHNTDNMDVTPLFSTVKLTGSGSHPLSTVPYAEDLGDVGLTTSAVMESVAFNKDVFWDAMQYYTNKSMLRKVTGSMRKVIVTRDRPHIYFTDNFTQPIVKRGNQYTFCGMLIHVPQGSGGEQLFKIADTTAIGHVNVHTVVRYSEWNPTFEQAAS